MGRVYAILGDIHANIDALNVVLDDARQQGATNFVSVGDVVGYNAAPAECIRIVRDGTVIFEGSIASLKRFKDDVKSVRQGYECGIGINGFQDLKVGDSIEGYVVKEIERTE